MDPQNAPIEFCAVHNEILRTADDKAVHREIFKCNPMRVSVHEAGILKKILSPCQENNFGG